MSVSLNSGGWEAEARALVDDIKQHVHSIQVSSEFKSTDMRIYFDIVTLERDKLIVSMDSGGFRICGRLGGQGDESQAPETGAESTSASASSVATVYETINALLDDNSPKYRDSFARSLMDKINSIH